MNIRTIQKRLILLGKLLLATAVLIGPVSTRVPANRNYKGILHFGGSEGRFRGEKPVLLHRDFRVIPCERLTAKLA